MGGQTPSRSWASLSSNMRGFSCEDLSKVGVIALSVTFVLLLSGWSTLSVDVMVAFIPDDLSEEVVSKDPLVFMDSLNQQLDSLLLQLQSHPSLETRWATKDQLHDLLDEVGVRLFPEAWTPPLPEPLSRLLEGKHEGPLSPSACVDLKGRCEYLEKEHQQEAQFEKQMTRQLTEMWFVRDVVSDRPKRLAYLHNYSLDITDEKKLVEILQWPPAGLPEDLPSYVEGWLEILLLFNDLQGEKLEEFHRSLEALVEQRNAQETLVREISERLTQCRERFAAVCLHKENFTGFFFPSCRLPDSSWIGHGTAGGEPIPPERQQCMEEMVPRNAYFVDHFLLPDRVNFSFILHSSEHPEAIGPIMKNIQRCVGGRSGGGELPRFSGELLVNVDEIGSWSRWIAWHDHHPDLVVPTFSYHQGELRGYSRLARYATGDVLVLLEDTWRPPKGCAWINDTFHAMAAWPRLGVLGMGDALRVYGSDGVEGRVHAAGQRDAFDYMDLWTGLLMQFSSAVYLGPLAIRARALAAVGGLNEALSQPGEAAPWVDVELCTRMWMAGYQVAQLYVATEPTNSPGGYHEEHPLSKHAVSKNVNKAVNHPFFLRYYEKHMQNCHASVRASNALLKSLRGPSWA